MKATIVKLTAFIVVCLGFTAYLGFTIGNIRLENFGPFDDSYELTATFDDVTGLLVDDNVKVAGVRVGKVKGIEIDKGKAVVRFQVRNGLKLAADTQAAVRWRNLLGQRYVYLYPGTAPDVLDDGDRVARTRSVVDLGELFNRLGPIVQAIDPQQVNTFLDAVVGALDGNQAKVSQAIDDLARVAGSLATRDEAIGRMIENLDTVAGAVTSREQQIKVVLDNLVTLAQTFSRNTDVLDRTVDELGDFTDNLGFLLSRNRTQIESILSGLRVLTDEIDNKLPTLDSALTDLDETAKRLFNASRHGEWLNQVIPCGGFTYPDRIDAQYPQGTCDTHQERQVPRPASTATPTSGAGAVSDLLGVAR
jgi:phospholipid/cholesterol/gamma-HCH transport system substrate-binding protein